MYSTPFPLTVCATTRCGRPEPGSGKFRRQDRSAVGSWPFTSPTSPPKARGGAAAAPPPPPPQAGAGGPPRAPPPAAPPGGGGRGGALPAPWGGEVREV